MKVVQVSIGRFHHFHLARQMERFGVLDSLWTGYPKFKLRDEAGIPAGKIRSFPWLQTLYMGWSRVPMLGRSRRLHRDLNWLAQESLDRRVTYALREACALVALSGQGEHAGRRAQLLGGFHICDRGSSHIVYQDTLLRDEHRRWGIAYTPIDPRMIEKEQREYASADVITVPSQFAKRSFETSGVPSAKICQIPYGGRLDRFKPQGEPARESFDVLFVGHVSLRKGFPDLLDAFARLNHAKKRLRVIGSIDPAIAPLLAKLPSDKVEYLGIVPNDELAKHYSASHVMVLPSIEEGLAMVMAEAMACGCPVIASENTGAEDLFSDQDGLIVPIRSPEALGEALNRLAGDRTMAQALRARARIRIQALNGWNDYGADWLDLLARCSPAFKGIADPDRDAPPRAALPDDRLKGRA